MCSFFSVEFVRTAYRLDDFEFLTKFNSVNCVRLNSPMSSCAVCLPVENCFLYVCYFSNSKNSEYFRIRNRCPTTAASTEFQAEHEYRNGLFKFVEMENKKRVAGRRVGDLYFLPIKDDFFPKNLRKSARNLEINYRWKRLLGPEKSTKSNSGIQKLDQTKILITETAHLGSQIIRDVNGTPQSR